MTRDDAYELLEEYLRRHLLFLVKTQKKRPLPRPTRINFAMLALALSSKKFFKTLQIRLEWI